MGEHKPPDRTTIPGESPGSDPYNREPAAPAGEVSKRRSLDDMRQLSESKKAPHRQAPAQTQEPFERMARMAMLRTDLERALTEIETLAASGVTPGDLVMTHLRKQLCRAAHHLDEVIDCLMPLEDGFEREAE